MNTTLPDGYGHPIGRGIRVSLDMLRLVEQLPGPVKETFGYIVSALAGVFAQRAADAWWLHAVHDSVLRHCYLNKDWHHAKVRGLFCAIVNGKLDMVDIGGDKVAAWKGRMKRNVLFLVLTASIVGVVTASSKMANNSLIWKLSEPAVAGLIWLFFAWRLHRPTHRTTLIVKQRDGSQKYLELGGERAEDGMPTHDIGWEPEEK